MARDFDNNTAIQLYTFLATFNDTICYCDSVTCFEGRMLFASSKCFFSNFN